MVRKNFCPIHFYYYDGNECPFCREDRVKALDKRFNKKEDNIVEEKVREVTQNDLDKLVAKFNKK